MLAAWLGRRTGIPVVHLDPLFWRRGWTPAPQEEAREALAAVARGERWIIDGNFLAEKPEEEARFERADTVVFLDAPRTTCLWRVVKRVARGGRRSRADLPEGCAEGIDLQLLRWIWSYPSSERPRVLALLAELERRGVHVHRLRTPNDVERFVETA